MKPVFSKEFLEHEYHVSKKSMSMIAKENDVDRRTVSYWFSQFDIPRRSREDERLNKLEREKGFLFTVENILGLINQGYFIKDIAEKYGVSRGTVSGFLSRKGINMRNHLLQRTKQSEMLTLNNPVPKGSLRTDEEKENMSFARRLKNKELYLSWIEDKELYTKRARYYAYERCNFLPEHLEIDHLFSIEDGYNNKVPIYLISHPHNLRFTTPKENREKSSFSIISFDEFKHIVGVQRLFRKEVEPSGSKSGEQS